MFSFRKLRYEDLKKKEKDVEFVKNNINKIKTVLKSRNTLCICERGDHLYGYLNTNISEEVVVSALNKQLEELEMILINKEMEFDRLLNDL